MRRKAIVGTKPTLTPVNHQAYRTERDGDEEAEHRSGQHVGQNLRHFQNGSAASAFA
jgi:hypothetical protein